MAYSVFMNTPQSGQFRWIIFKEAGDWIGAALEFNIVVTGEDPRVVEAELNEAVVGYLESTRAIKGFRPQQINAVLNQETDEEYETRWNNAQQNIQADTPSPLSSDIYKFWVANLAVA